MANGLRYETGRDMPPGMQELTAKKLVQMMQKATEAPEQHPAASPNNERRIIVENAEMSAKLSIGAIKDGGIFRIGSMEFIKFPSQNGQIPIVTRELAFLSEFGENNNLKKSDILTRLETEILPDIMAAVGQDNLCAFKTDLTSLDGLNPYGELESIISLPTLDFYRANVAIFDRHKPEHWWWLATPDSASPHGDAHWVLSVHPDGFVGDYNCRIIEYGVRPMLHLKSTALVDVVE